MPTLRVALPAAPWATELVGLTLRSVAAVTLPPFHESHSSIYQAACPSLSGAPTLLERHGAEVVQSRTQSAGIVEAKPVDDSIHRSTPRRAGPTKLGFGFLSGGISPGSRHSHRD